MAVTAVLDLKADKWGENGEEAPAHTQQEACTRDPWAASLSSPGTAAPLGLSWRGPRPSEWPPDLHQACFPAPSPPAPRHRALDRKPTNLIKKHTKFIFLTCPKCTVFSVHLSLFSCGSRSPGSCQLGKQVQSDLLPDVSY